MAKRRRVTRRSFLWQVNTAAAAAALGETQKTFLNLYFFFSLLSFFFFLLSHEPSKSHKRLIYNGIKQGMRARKHLPPKMRSVTGTAIRALDATSKRIVRRRRHRRHRRQRRWKTSSPTRGSNGRLLNKQTHKHTHEYIFIFYLYLYMRERKRERECVCVRLGLVVKLC